MFWNSIPLMTLVDLLVIGGAVWLIATLLQRWPAARRLGLATSVSLVAAGVAIVALFYATDLVSMWLLPRFVPMDAAMAWMHALHDDWRWPVTLVELGLIGVGMMLLLRKIVPKTAEQLDWLEHAVEERTRALEISNDELRREIHERIEAQRALERHRGELQSMVESRTNELAASREALAHSQHLASLGTLAAGVAHEINNPIGAIMNSAEYALMLDGAGRADDARHADDPAIRDEALAECRRALETSVREARRCGEIVRSLLTFHQVEGGARGLHDLGELLDAAIAELSSFAEDNGVALRGPWMARTVVAEVEPIGMERVFANLIRNAIQASPAGGVVEITLYEGDEDASIAVRDHGPGIPEADLERIFDPFYTSRLELGGTGLGLSVSHGIVASHDGEIAVESTIGAGTTFRVLLPKKAPTATAGATPAARAASEVAVQSNSSRTMMVSSRPGPTESSAAGVSASASIRSM